MVDVKKDQCVNIFSKDIYSIARFIRNSVATDVESSSDLNTRLSSISIDDRSTVNHAEPKTKITKNRVNDGIEIEA